MIITYIDDLGEALVNVDEHGIDFYEGFAYFSSKLGKDYEINISHIISISQGYENYESTWLH